MKQVQACLNARGDEESIILNSSEARAGLLKCHRRR